MRGKVLLLIFVLYGLCGRAQVVKTEEQEIKVGLVLSGGGAKGLAHIGALKIIEQAGVKIDYIGGSSMGAIIGGLYASGYTANQLDSIFKNTDFQRLIQDDLPRRAKDYNIREGSQRYAFSLPFDNFKLTIPSGLSKGQSIYNIFAQFTYPVREIENFEDLPTPFFAIGTDIETGERIVLDKGSLPKSILASGALPSLFKPVEIEGRLISDGGIMDNFPIEEMKEKGVDYIIGVDVQDSLVDRKDLKSVFDVLTQVNNFRTIKAMKEKRTQADIYIKPDISNFSVISFDKGAEIIQSGEEAALKAEDELKELGLRQSRGAFVKPNIKTQDTIYVNSVSINGLKNYKRNYVQGKLQIPTNEPINYQILNEGLDNLSATENFDWIGYQLIPDRDNHNNLVLDLTESNSRTRLRFGLHYDQLYKSAALINLTHKNIFAKSDLLSTDFIVGDNMRYKFDYFIDKGVYWSIGIRSQLNQFNDNVDFGLLSSTLPDEYHNLNKIQLDYLDLTTQFFVETFIFRNFRFGMGFQHKRTKLKTETILLDEALSQNQNINHTVLEKSHSFGPYGYLEYDGYDNSYFPTRGLYFKANFDSFLFSMNESFDFKRFAIMKGELGAAFALLNKTYLRVSSGMGFHLGNTEMKALDFSLGGYGNNYINNIEPFFGYNFNSAVGNSFIKATLELDYMLVPKNHIVLGYNIANIGDDLLKNGKLFETPELSGVFLGYGIETFLGPMEIYYSFSPEKVSNSHIFVSLGFWF